MRQFADTRNLSATPLNYKTIGIKALDGTIKEGGIFGSNTLYYRVVTEPMGYEVMRKDSEFYSLRRMLVKAFPHVIVPPLP